MKPFSGGQMLDASISPFGTALTPYQCIKYALDKPGVLTVLPGASDEAEVKALLEYYDKTDEELDYSVIGTAKNTKLHKDGALKFTFAPFPFTVGTEVTNAGGTMKLYHVSDRLEGALRAREQEAYLNALGKAMAELL
jgi:hypothetical protein